ncbi:HemK2/MTQ2 family protein methyltransferase [Streptomyces sp. NPDC057746]|uniref:HemK2/MTQ2 family protein methyltransferase n=1 Tax=Streptomyces sp. NPDC057746 TaxID=3346237 RepID=UPI0036BD3549
MTVPAAPPWLPSLATPPGVYTPQADTLFLATALRREALAPGTDVLDLGTGNGTLAVCAAQQGARVTATDIARRALATARLNALRAGQHIDFCRGDLLSPISGRRFDLVVCNPPYVPAPEPPPGRTEDGDSHAEPGRAWNAGRDGRAILDRICEEVPQALRPGGILLMVQSALSGPEETLLQLTGSGLQAAVSDRMYLPFGPVLRSRLPWLRDRRLVTPRESFEELVIIRARQA